MNEPDAPDPELAELRARLRSEILAHHAAPPPTPPAASPPVDLTSSDFAAFLADHPRIVVDVWAPWCGPCRTMAPILESLARSYAGRVRFGKLNADQEPALAGRFQVQGIPTLLLFDRGRLVDRVVGARPQEWLDQRLRAVFRLDGAGGPDA